MNVVLFLTLTCLIQDNLSLDKILSEWSRFADIPRVDVAHESTRVGETAPIEISLVCFRENQTLKKVQRNHLESVYGTNERYCFHVEKNRDVSEYTLNEIQLPTIVNANPQMAGKFYPNRIPMENLVAGRNIRDLLADKRIVVRSFGRTADGSIKLDFDLPGTEKDIDSTYIPMKNANLVLMGTPPYHLTSMRCDLSDGQFQLIHEYEVVGDSYRIVRKLNTFHPNEGSGVDGFETKFKYDVPTVENSDFYLTKYGFDEPSIPEADKLTHGYYLLVGLGIALVLIGVFLVPFRRRRS